MGPIRFRENGYRVQTGFYLGYGYENLWVFRYDFGYGYGDFWVFGFGFR